MRITAKEYREMISKKKKSKYNNKKVKVGEHTFDSKLEADYYKYLLLLQQSGEVKEIELQPKFRLQEGFTKNKVRHRPIDYIADFKVTYKDGEIEIVDVKGYKTEVFKIKQKLFEYKYKDLHLKIVTKDNFKL